MSGESLWVAVGAIGQLVGSVAVLVTLIYLSIQVRETRREVRRSAMQVRSEQARQNALSEAGDPHSAALWAKAAIGLGQPAVVPFAHHLMDAAGLTLDEAMTLYWRQVAWWQSRVHTMLVADQLEPSERRAFDGTLRAVYGSAPVFTTFFETMKGTLNQDAVAYVERLLREAPTDERAERR